jgi:hypothetical protein
MSATRCIHGDRTFDVVEVRLTVLGLSTCFTLQRRVARLETPGHKARLRATREFSA